MESHQVSETESKRALPSQKGRTITLYFCGTGSNLDDAKESHAYHAGEAITSTYEITLGRPYFDKLLIEGVGSGERDTDSYWVNYTKRYTATGQLIAAGIDERIQHALAVLKNNPLKQLSPEQQKIHEALKNAPPIDRVIIAGWSRGGAAAISIAYHMALDDDLKNIPVYLALFDPVPGIGCANESNTTLLPNVKQCIVCYAQDERSIGFSPVIPLHDPLKTQFLPIIVPGGHAQVVGSINDHGGNKHDLIEEVGKVMKGCVEHALNNFGTQLDQAKTIPAPLNYLLNLYKAIQANENKYRKAAQDVAYTANSQSAQRTVLWEQNYITNHTLEDVIQNKLKFKIPNTARKKYLDYFHYQLDACTEKAKIIVKSFDCHLRSLIQKGVALKKEDLIAHVQEGGENLKNETAVNPILVCAIAEQLQIHYKEHHLQLLNARCYDQEKLKKYFEDLCDEIVKIYNNKLHLENTFKEQEAKISTLNTLHKQQLLEEEKISAQCLQAEIATKIAGEQQRQAEIELKYSQSIHLQAEIESKNALAKYLQAEEEFKMATEKSHREEKKSKIVSERYHQAWAQLNAARKEARNNPNFVKTIPKFQAVNDSRNVGKWLGMSFSAMAAAPFLFLSNLIFWQVGLVILAGISIGTLIGYTIGRYFDELNDRNNLESYYNSIDQYQDNQADLKERETNYLKAERDLSSINRTLVDTNNDLINASRKYSDTEQKLIEANRRLSDAKQASTEKSRRLTDVISKLNTANEELAKLTIQHEDTKQSINNTGIAIKQEKEVLTTLAQKQNEANRAFFTLIKESPSEKPLPLLSQNPAILLAAPSSLPPDLPIDLHVITSLKN